MKKFINKEIAVLLVSVILLAGIVLFLDFIAGGPSGDGSLRVASRTYQPTELKDTPYWSDRDSRPEIDGGRNPFVSSTQKVEFWVDLLLPEAIFKKPGYILLSPVPDLKYNRSAKAEIPNDQSVYKYSVSGNGARPQLSDLLSLDECNDLIEETKLNRLVESIPLTVEIVEDDVIRFNDGAIRTGRVLSADETKIIFLPKGSREFISCLKKDIVSMDRHFTSEETYKQKLKRILADDALAHYRLAQWCAEKGLETKVIKELLTAIKINGTNLKYYQAAGAYYRQRLDWDSELKLYQKALKTPLNNKEVIHLKLGEVYQLLGLPGESVKSLKAAVKFLPKYVDGWVKLGDTRCRQGDYELARAAYQQAKGYEPARVDLWLGEGRLDFKTGDLPGSRDKFERVLESEADNYEALNLVGVASVLLGEHNPAVNYFKKAIKVKPDAETPWINLAACYLAVDEYKIAELLLNQARERDPVGVGSYLGLGYLYWSQGDISRGQDSFQEGLQIEPKNIELLYALAQVSLEKGDLSDAEKKLRRCLKLAPLRYDIFYQLGIIDFLRKKYERADWYFSLYLKKLLEPVESPSTLPGANVADLTMAVLARLGANKIKSVDSLFSQAIELNDQYPPILNAQAYGAYLNRDKNKAISKLKETLTYDSKNTYARQTLSLIQEMATQVLWVDTFDRPDSMEIGQGWEESEPYGIEIMVKNKELRFTGTQKIKDQGVTKLLRQVDRDIFIRLDTIFIPDPASSAVFGICVISPRTGEALAIAIVNDRLAYSILKRSDGASGKWINLTKKLDQKKIALGLRKEVGPRRALEFKCSLNGNPYAIPSDLTRFLRSARTFSVGIFGYGELEKKWALKVSSVNIFEKRQGDNHDH